MTHQIRIIRRSLSSIGQALRRLSASLREAEKVERRATKTSRRKRKLSPGRRAALKLQGSYVGYMRQLNSKQKSQVKAVKVKKGFPAAISLARRLAKG